MWFLGRAFGLGVLRFKGLIGVVEGFRVMSLLGFMVGSYRF